MKSSLKLAKGTTPTKNKLSWKWAADGADLTDFGNPSAGSTNFRLCIYDDGNPVISAALAAGGTCPTDPCWLPGATGFKYKNKTGNADGLT